MNWIVLAVLFVGACSQHSSDSARQFVYRQEPHSIEQVYLFFDLSSMQSSIGRRDAESVETFPSDPVISCSYGAFCIKILDSVPIIIPDNDGQSEVYGDYVLNGRAVNVGRSVCTEYTLSANGDQISDYIYCRGIGVVNIRFNEGRFERIIVLTSQYGFGS